MVVTGSGVTAAATGGHQLSSWPALIASGIEYASELPSTESGVLDAARSLLDVGTAGALIAAAELVTEALGGRDGGEYARWLTENIGALELRDRSVPQALTSLGVPVATTNYDDLIEREAGWERLTWLEGGAVQRALQGDERAVVHLHGHWRTPRSVILGVRSYEELAHDGATQALQRAMATMSSLLFVGVGDGASDPNFGALRMWLARTFADSQYRHFRLCLEDELEALREEHGLEERIVPLVYGSEHKELAGFLRELATISCSPAPKPRSGEAVSGGSAGLPARPVTLGRDDQVQAVVARLLADPPQPVLLNGAPGIGKTNLTLAALHDPGVVKQFGSRRWFVRCEGVQSATGLEGEIATAIGLAPTGDALGAAIKLLSRAPAVLALDNLETPWESDALAVEELIGVVAQVPGLALLASVRGLERPSGVRWAPPKQLEPLDPASAHKLFVSIAPEGFDTPALDGLLEEMGGIPLAIELLAYVADGESDLDHLIERWRGERARLLARGPADHRLLSIAVSVDTSWNSPAMTKPAKRLLALLGGLPDGIADDDLDALLPGDGPAAANILRRRGLAVEEIGRLRTFPPVRLYAADAHPPAAADLQRATEHFCRRAEELGVLAGGQGGAQAISRLSSESANITAAVNRTLESGEFDLAYGAAAVFIEAARFSGTDVASILQALLNAAEQSGNARHLAAAHEHVGDIALVRSDHDAACNAYQRALPLYQQVGDVLGEANCVKSLGDIDLQRSDHDAARKAYQQALSLYQQVGDMLGEANCIRRLGESDLQRSDYDAARKAYQQALSLYRQVGDVLGEAGCVRSLGDIDLQRSDHDAARKAYQQALSLYRQVGSVLGEANCIQCLGDIDLRRSDHDAARKAYHQALELYVKADDPYSVGYAHVYLARLAGEGSTCRHVSAARVAWSRIKRDDLLAGLSKEFPDCD